MAVTLDATPGSSTANSYITVAGAQAYIDNERLDDPPAEWVDANADKKAKALINATTEINALPFPGRSYWCGTLPDGRRRQSLFFPRTQDGILGALQIPKEVQQATVELALYLLSRSPEEDMRRALQNQGLKGVQLSRSISEQWHPGSGELINYCPAAKRQLQRVGFGSPLMLG